MQRGDDIRQISCSIRFQTCRVLWAQLNNENNVSLANLVVRQMFGCQTRASSRGRNAETSHQTNEPPLNEFQFAVEKEINVRSRHSRAEKHFAWNVTSAQNSGGDVGETKKHCARKGTEKTERLQVHSHRQHLRAAPSARQVNLLFVGLEKKGK